jgi:hypothetical protein
MVQTIRAEFPGARIALFPSKKLLHRAPILLPA